MTDPVEGDEPAADEPLVVDSGPLTMHATTQHGDQDEEVRDGGDRPGGSE